jgi:deoxyribonuclease V
VIACLDAAYLATETSVACVLATDWLASSAAGEIVRTFPQAAPYQSGEFFKRELPGLIQLLSELSVQFTVVIVDGYVWLDSNGKPGLGGHLFSALGGQIAVVGVAKTRFVGAPAIPVLRGTSRSPLFVTSAGIPLDEAAAWVRQMHGRFRLPTLLKRADSLSRGKAPATECWYARPSEGGVT